MTPDLPSFRHWAGTHAAPLAETDLLSHDWTQDGPHLLLAHHGTTHDFRAFSLERSTHDGQFGRMLYFTSCASDAGRNYAHEEGPDLKNRIENLGERIAQDLENDPGAAGLADDADDETISARADALAREALIGSAPRVLDLYLRLNRPFVVDAAGQINCPLFDEHYDMEDATQRVAGDTGLSVADIEADWESHEDAIYEALDAAHFDMYEDLSRGVMVAAHQVGCDAPNLPDFIHPLSELTCDGFEKALRDSEDIMFLENEEGDLVSNSFLAALIEQLGFDSIVLLNADRRFTTMHMEPETTHIHLFAAARTQVKSVENAGTFDPNAADIYQ